MNDFEIKNILDTFSIITDSREHPTPQSEKRYQAFGVSYQRGKLDYGDYTFNFILNNEPFYDVTKPIYPCISIERKESLNELASCFTHSRKRFQAEMERAKEHGARIFLLTENASWESLINGRYKSKLNPKAYFASITAWMIRYGLQVIFCKEETSGKIIKEILYRDLKERLENGEIKSE